MSDNEEQPGPRGRDARRRSDEARFFLASAVESLEDSVVSVDSDAVITGWNKGAERLYGYTAEEVIGRPLNLLTLPEDLRQVFADMDGVGRGGGVEVYETEGAHGDGRRLSVTRSPVKDDSGRVIGVSTVARDVTERRREELDRRFLLELGERLRSGELNPGGLLAEVTRATCEHLGAARCLFVEIDEAGDRGAVRHEFRRGGVPPVPCEYRVSDYSPATLEEIKGGRVVVNHDAERDPRTAAIFETTYEPYGERSYVSVPLFTDGRWRAIFWISDDRPRRWRPQEVALLEGVAERAWLAAEKLRNEADLRESERRFRALVSQATAGISQVDREGRFLFVNDRYCEIVGYPRGELLGMRMQDISDPETVPANLELFRRAWEEGAPFVIEKQYLRKDGSRVWVNNNVAPVAGAGGRAESVVCVTIDVTERVAAEEGLKRARAEAERQRRLYDTILSSTPDLVYVFDLGHRFTYANDVLLRMWGRTWDEAVGKNCLELGYPDWHAAMHDRELEEVKATKRPVRGVVPFDGTFGRRLYDYIFVPIIGADGEVEAVAGTTRDVTEIKEAEESLRQSRETLSLAMGAGRMGAWSLDLSTDAVYWSPELEAIFGLTPGTFAGTLDDFYEYVYEEDRGRVAAEVRGAIAEGRGYVVEFRYRHADGGVKWMEGRGRAAYSAEGRPTNVFGIGIDITDRKRAELNAGFLAGVVGDSVQAATPEQIVRAVGERLNRFLGTPTCAFLEVDEAAETVRIDYEWHEEGAPSLTGAYRLSEFVTPEFLRGAMSGETLVIRDVAADARIVDPAPWSALRIGSHVNVPLIRKGQWRFSLCVYHAGAYDWREDEVRLMEELAARVWSRLERAFAERERERLLEWESSARLRAEEANRLKDEFLATVSHELRTPLTAITGWAHLLETGDLDREMARHAVSVIRRNCEQQKQIVEDVLDVSRFITGKLQLEREAVDLSEVALAALETVRPAAEARNIQLRSELRPGVEVWGDPRRLQQVVWNLLTNAVKFTPPGGRVSVSVGRLLTHARVEVSDTGQGIAAEFLPHVFDRFRQADGSTTRRHGGLGLGLSIVRHLVEAHGGSVHAYSAGEGQGATFTVDLPLPVGALVEGAGARDEGGAQTVNRPGRVAAVAAGDDAGVVPPLVSVRVLLVDDEPDGLELISLILRRAGAEVTAAGSTAEALDALGRSAPDVIVADIGMPEADGYELMRRVRSLSRDEGRDTPAVALTAYAAEADRARALRSGFQKHLTKPVDPEALCAAVADLAGRNVRGEV